MEICLLHSIYMYITPYKILHSPYTNTFKFDVPAVSLSPSLGGEGMCTVIMKYHLRTLHY